MLRRTRPHPIPGGAGFFVFPPPAAMKPDLRDAFAFVGLALMGAGAALVYVPAGLILVGVVFLAMARPWAS